MKISPRQNFARRLTLGLTLAVSLSLATNLASLQTALADESAAQFVQRYLTAVAKAKSPTELIAFRKPRPDQSPDMPGGPSGFGGADNPKATAADKEMMAKLMGAVLEMEQSSTPLTATVTDTQDRAGKTLLALKATAMPAAAKMDLSTKGNLTTGKMLLEKGSNGWLIDDEYWHCIYANGLTVNSGHDPDALSDHATATNTADGAAGKSPITVSASSPADKYTDQIMSAIGDVWKDPAPGTGHITVEFKNDPTGKFELLGVADKDGSKDAEALAQAAMAKIALPPLPGSLSDQPIINIQLSWSPKFSETMKMVQLLHSATLVK